MKAHIWKCVFKRNRRNILSTNNNSIQGGNMIVRTLLAAIIVFALLFAGCGKKEEDAKTPDVEQPAQTQPSGQQQMQLPKINAAQTAKVIESLDEFTGLVKKFQGKAKPTNPADAQKQTQEILGEVNGLAQKYGFKDGDEYSVCLAAIIQVSMVDKANQSLEQQIAQLPEAQRNSPEMQAQVQNIKDQHKQLKDNFGDDVFKVVRDNDAKINAFIQQQQMMQQQQMQQQQMQQQMQAQGGTPKPAPSAPPQGQP